MIEHGPLLERLLAGEFICAVSDENAFRHLTNEETREAIDSYLRPLNRRLASNDEGSVYFLAWRQLNEAARDQLSRQLGETVNSLLPLLEWLQLVQEALGRDTLAAPGDVLKPAEFSAKCEDNQSLRERLERLATDSFFGSQSDQLDAQVKQLFKRLKEHGYLLQPHTERQVFVVTGKIDYLIEVVRFIRDEENLPIDAEREEGTQEALL
ncbi:MAG: hypothetical protein JJT87_11765 [Halomonas sp.]|uniref:DUF4194 domain-containing protein n=1 Tax=Vreelandella nigrificans TaxID=2042704 RepID=A0A2A4HNN0_9GAMM|nr:MULTISPECIES: hypothetical protein [Halomonas]AQU83428.1 hypothetical protein B2G49_13115 [Halomonas sp. 'Soap Lake \